MSLTLFDFEVEETRTEEEVIVAFEILKQEFKKRGNYHCMKKDELPFQARSFISLFLERGWVTMREARVYPDRSLLDYHTPEKAIEQYQNDLEKFLNKEKKCWYKDFLTVRNNAGPCDFKNKEDKVRFEKLKEEVTKEAAITLGLEHFMSVPTSRGHKMNRFDSKWERKHVIPMIASYVIPMTDYDEVKAFFRNHAFFCGRRDWAWNMSVAPYPEYKTVFVTQFDIACLAEAKDQKTVELILSYTGGSWSNHDAHNYKILYPEGWSYEKYQESLSFDDLEKIYNDQVRLTKLHKGA